MCSREAVRPRDLRRGPGQGASPGLPQVYGIIKEIINGSALRCACCAHQHAICLRGWKGFVPGDREQRGSGSRLGPRPPAAGPRPVGLLLPSSEPQILHEEKKDRGSYSLYESK